MNYSLEPGKVMLQQTEAGKNAILFLISIDLVLAYQAITGWIEGRDVGGEGYKIHSLSVQAIALQTAIQPGAQGFAITAVLERYE